MVESKSVGQSAYRACRNDSRSDLAMVAGRRVRGHAPCCDFTGARPSPSSPSRVP